MVVHKFTRVSSSYVWVCFYVQLCSTLLVSPRICEDRSPTYECTQISSSFSYFFFMSTQMNHFSRMKIGSQSVYLIACEA